MTVEIGEHTRVALVYGGAGSEREVSLKTGAAFREALLELGVTVLELDFSRDAVTTLAQELPDVALIAMHGWMGEGGPIQGLLECLDIPYTGSGLAASTIAIDKLASKRVLAQLGVATPAWTTVASADDARLETLALPVVVKPPREGSSVGISIVKTRDALKPAVELALRYDNEVLIETFVKSRELSVGLFDGTVMGIMEIAPASGVYDYEAKYLRSDTNYLLPAPIDASTRERVEALAVAAWNAIGCRGVGRVDILLDEAGDVWVLELNTVPGMTKTSIVPKMAAANGVPFARFVGEMLEAATTDARVRGGAAQ